MPGNYTLELELFSLLNGSADGFEIFADGTLLSGYSSIVSSNGSNISLTVSYGGAMPSSLEFRFNDTDIGTTDTIQVRAVKINDKYVNTGNYLSTDILNDGDSATVDVAGADFIFDDSEPASTEFTTGATQTFTTGADKYRGNNGTNDEVFDLLDGNDNADLGSGDDKVNGNNGRDTIRGGGGNDLISGGADNDRLFGQDGNDQIYGGTGNDMLFGNNGDDKLFGNDGNDSLSGHDGEDIIVGGLGQDRLSGGADNDQLFGGADDDQVIGGAGNDTLDGGDGEDYLHAGIGDDTLNSGDGNDLIVGSLGLDIIHGDSGDDTIYIATNDYVDGEEIYGGAGTDGLILSGAVVANFTTGVLDGLETLTGSNADQDITLSLNQIGQFTTVDLGGGGNDTIRTQFEGDYDAIVEGVPTVTNAENGFLLGSANVDTLTAGEIELSNLVYGTGTIDFGGDTEDTLVLTENSATLNFLSTIDGSLLGLENIDASMAVAPITIDLAAQSEDFTLTGSGNDDSLTTGSGNDIVFGQDGADTLNGGAGDDALYGDVGSIDFVGGLLVIEAENYENSIDRGGKSWSTLDDVNASAGQVVSVQPNTGDILATTGIENTAAELTYTVNFTTTGTFYVWIKAGAASGGTNDSIHLGFDGVQQTGNGGVQTSSNYGWHNTETGTGSVVTVNVTTTGTHILNLWMREDGAPIDKIIIADSAGYTPTGNGPDATTRTSTAGGVDIVNGGAGDDHIFGDFDNDILSGGDDDDLIYGGVGNDILNGDSGIDTLYGEDGNDTFNIANGDFEVGETIIGGDDTDEIILTNATIVDFTNGTVNTVETLTGSAAIDDVTLSATQYASFTTIDLQGASDNINVFADGSDISGSGTPITSAENGRIIGDGSDNSVTMTGAQIDAILNGTGVIDFGGGTNDILNITSTSLQLNTYGSLGGEGRIENLETISASGAGSAVTIDLGNQSDDIDLIGSNFDDTVTGTTGDNILTGGTGVDTIIYDNATSGITVDLSETAAQNTGGAGTDTLSGFENITASDFDDNIKGNDSDNIINAGDGDDFIGSALATGNHNFVINGSTETLYVDFDGSDHWVLVGRGREGWDFDTDGQGITANISSGLGTTAAFTPIAYDDAFVNDIIDSTTISGNLEDTEIRIKRAANITGTEYQEVRWNAVTQTDWTFDFDNDQYIITHEVQDSVLGAASAIVIEDTRDNNPGSANNHERIFTWNWSGHSFERGFSYGSTVQGVNNNDPNTFLWEFANERHSVPYAEIYVKIDISTLGLGGTLGNDIIDGGAGNDTLYGGAGEDTLNGGADDDALYGEAGNDTLNGGDGDDEIFGNEGADVIDGGAGNDTLNGGNDADTINGGDDDDDIVGGAGNDTLNGEAGNDTLNGGDGNDTINGGADIDTVSYAFVSGAVTVDLAITTAQNTINAGMDTLSNVENIIGSSFADTLTGDANDNVIEGGLGNDTLDGGAGNDTISLANATGTTYLYLTNTSQNTLSSGTDNFVNFENILGSNFTDVLRGDAGVNIIDGGRGNDQIRGGGGADILIGGIGVDWIDYRSSSAGVNVNLVTNVVSGGDATGDIISGFEYIFGSDFDDVLIGTAGRNAFRSGDGADIIDGAGGTTDYIDYIESASAVNVNLTTNVNTGGDAAGDTISNVEWIYGSNHDDTITGDGANNLLYGRNGDDIIYGKDGYDRLYGASGADTFVFEAASAYNDRDQIHDFNDTSGDALDLSDLISGFNGNISEYVNFVDDGAHLIVRVDGDGLAGGSNFSDVTRLLNDAGLDETTLYNNGNIIV